jgi:hypothetical protein
MAETAVNPSTGEAVQWDGTAWKPLPMARNPQTGETRHFVDNEWKALGGGQQPAAAPAQPQPEMSFGQKMLAGAKRVGTGVMDLPTGINQMLANAIPEGAKPAANTAFRLMDAIPGMVVSRLMIGDIPSAEVANQRVTDREAEYQRARAAAGSTGIDFARLGGQTISTLPAMLAIPGAGGFLGAAGIGAGTGAGMSALTPVPNAGDGYAGEVAKNALAGGVAGAVGGVAGKALGSIIAPRIDPNVRALGNAGVELTPGQIAGGGFRNMEDVSRSIPIVGTGIGNAQRRSLESFNRSVANEVLAPIGQTVPKNAPVGRALMTQVDDAISSAYQSAHAKVKPFTPDRQFLTDFENVVNGNILMPDQKAFFTAVVQRQIMPRMGKADAIDGKTAQEITSELKRYARSYGASPDVPDQELAKAFRALTDTFDDMVARTNPAIAPEIKKANAAFARLIRMESASAGAGATEGVFTAPQFSTAVRRGDMSPRKGEFARGGALMQELSDAGRAVLPSTVPDSGTGLRTAVNTGAAGLTATGAGMIDPTLAGLYLGATGVGRAAYSEPATRAFRAAMLARRPEMIGLLGEGVRRGGQVSGVPLGGLLRQGM